MHPCWVLIVSRGLEVWLPPELYLQRDLAIRESTRWRTTFRLPPRPPEFSSRARCLHLLEAMFPEPWRACPVRLGLTWSARSYPKMKIELMAADEKEAVDWLRRKTPRGTDVDQREQVEFLRRGVLASAGVFRVKRVMGF